MQLIYLPFSFGSICFHTHITSFPFYSFILLVVLGASCARPNCCVNKIMKTAEKHVI